MKLKVGRYSIGPNVLMNVVFIGFLIGLHIGIIAAAHSNGKHTP
ncbi:hypothetical protein [Spirosoma oryzicola]|jgi:capsular polysaccharide biosynthesis protein|nr:hypothetical protein [Spirosoma oryzicola]